MKGKKRPKALIENLNSSTQTKKFWIDLYSGRTLQRQKREIPGVVLFRLR